MINFRQKVIKSLFMELTRLHYLNWGLCSSFLEKLLHQLCSLNLLSVRSLSWWGKIFQDNIIQKSALSCKLGLAICPCSVKSYSADFDLQSWRNLLQYWTPVTSVTSFCFWMQLHHIDSYNLVAVLDIYIRSWPILAILLQIYTLFYVLLQG